MRQSIGHRGRQISYLDSGGPGEGPQRTLVFLHAFPMAAEMWQPQFDSIPAGWRFIAPDLRGFGQSDPGDPAEEPSVDDYGRDVLALLDALSVRRAAFAGLSMGGYAAFSVVRLEVERIAALVLADTRSEADSEPARASRDGMLAALTNEGPRGVMERMLPGLLGQTTRATRRDIVEYVRALGLDQSPTALAHGIQRLKSRPDATPLLERLEVPVLVVAGEEDQITTPDAARQLHSRIARSRLALIPRAGHLSNLEQPEEFNRVLGEFLTSIGG